jgi:hypothetical protein
MTSGSINIIIKNETHSFQMETSPSESVAGVKVRQTGFDDRKFSYPKNP